MQGKIVSHRQTDTEKWANPWFRKLTPKGKLIWMFMLDNCDCAGIWKEDLERVGFHIGMPVIPADLGEFEGKVLRLNEDTLFIRKFVKFQCGDEQLTATNNFHRGILKRFKDADINPESLLPSSIQKLVPDPDPDPDSPSKPLVSPSAGVTEPLTSPTKEKKGEGERERERGDGNGKENAEGFLQIPARARPKPGLDVAVDPEPTQAPEIVGHVIDKALGLEAPPPPPPAAPAAVAAAAKPAPDWPVPDNVIVGRFPAPAHTLATPPPTPPDPPPAAPERRVIAPARGKPATAPPGACVRDKACEPLPQDYVPPGNAFRRTMRGLWGAAYQPPHTDEPVTQRPEEASA